MRRLCSGGTSPSPRWRNSLIPLPMVDGRFCQVEPAWQTEWMSQQSSRYRGYRFPPEIIAHAVWLYHRFGLSFRDVEDLLAERGVTVT